MTNDKIDNKTTEFDSAHPAITQEALAQLGDGEIAYVRAIRSEDVADHVSAGAEDRAGRRAVLAARRRRHADHADRHARSRASPTPGARSSRR